MFSPLVFASDHALTNQKFVNCANIEILAIATPALPCCACGDKPSLPVPGYLQ
jgi:hypothetical protein